MWLTGRWRCSLTGKGKLFIISGPSGVGKGTIVSELLRRQGDRLDLSVSATTREPREGEEDGISYFFLTEEEFLKRVENGGFLEHASVHGHFYGTPRPPVEEKLEQGHDVILEIDVQGAMQVKDNFSGGVFIFILPPSISELRKRLVGRGTESEPDLELRMGKALEEIDFLKEYDYAVVNDDLRVATDELAAVIAAEHCRVGGEADSMIRKYREEF